MPAVISDTSPLQYLCQAEVLSLLPELFGVVHIPEAVAVELQAGRRRHITLPDPREHSWLIVRPLQQPALLSLAIHLGDGEKEVLALGLEMPGSLLLLDDRDARRHAELLGLRISGTLGVLLLAKERGKLAAVSPILKRLDALRFRLHPATRQAVLRIAGEPD